MVTAFVIWSAVAGICFLIGIWALVARKPVGFFTGAKAGKMRDTKAYNHAMAKMWIVFAIALELIGVPLLFIRQNSLVAVFIGGGAVVFIMILMMVYTRIENKYRIFYEDEEDDEEEEDE